MEKRAMEKLGIETSLLGFGCMRFPSTCPRTSWKRSTHIAFKGPIETAVAIYPTAAEAIGPKNGIIFPIATHKPRSSGNGEPKTAKNIELKTPISSASNISPRKYELKSFANSPQYIATVAECFPLRTSFPSVLKKFARDSFSSKI